MTGSVQPDPEARRTNEQQALFVTARENAILAIEAAHAAGDPLGPPNAAGQQAIARSAFYLAEVLAIATGWSPADD